MLCPIDQNELLITERQGIEIDYCPKCRGVWLDRGELDKIIERTAEVISPEPRPSRSRDDDKRRYEDRSDYDYKKKKKKSSLLGELFDF